jgi:hypothetical protein
MSEEALGVEARTAQKRMSLRRRRGSDEVRAGGEALVKFEGGGVASFEAPGEGSVGAIRKELLSGPESYG